MLAKALAELRAAKVGAEQAIFKSPPQTFDAFQKRLGFWLGLVEGIQSLERIAKESEND